MKQTVYVDVLVCINLIINYFILLAVARFLKIFVRRKRLLLGAGLGAVYSLYILLPEWDFFFSLFIKLLMSVTIVFAGFGCKSARIFIKTTACFYFMSFAFAGVLFGFWYLAAPSGMIMNNGIVYFSMSPLVLVAATVVCYGLIRLFQRLTGREQPKELYCDLEIDFEGKTVLIKAKVDTGNSLVEPFSNLPVVVAEYRYVEDLIPAESRAFFMSADSGYLEPPPGGAANRRCKCRLVPFKSVSGDGVLPAFHPDSVTLPSGGGGKKDAYVAVYGEGTLGSEFHALVNPELL